MVYKLKLPEGSRIHPVFHVSLLKKRVSDDEPVSVELPPLRKNGLFHLEPATLASNHRVQKGTKTVTEVLIQWEHLPREEATWEEYEQIQSSFPDFVMNLEDKVLSHRGSIDRIPDAEEDIAGTSHEAEVATRRSSRPRKPNKKYLG